MFMASEDRAMALSGRLDGRHASEMREALYARIEGEDGDVVVDLTEVESVDGTVIKMLAAAAVRLQRTGRHLVLRGCSPGLRRVLAFGGLRRLFTWDRG
jgi:anti-anti-sigma factor